MTASESGLIERIGTALRQRRSAFSGVRLGIGDDAALFRPRAGREIILTCDWSLEGTHFLPKTHPPDSVGWKCLARAVSDIVAMGGIPRCFLLSLALSTSDTGTWLDGFLAGLGRASRKFECVLAGGDTTRRKEILINVMVVGEVPAGRALLRSGARPGDLIYVSGRLGEAELGLAVLRRRGRVVGASRPLTKKHLYPEPRLALGPWLARKGLVSAMMDLSDGLSSDLPRVCAASGVGACVEIAKIPCSRNSAIARRHGLNLHDLALHGGEDYELLFTVPRRKATLLPRAFQGVPLKPIGEITANTKLVLREQSGRERPLEPGGWDPFRRPGVNPSHR